jgi:hypothetical protein
MLHFVTSGYSGGSAGQVKIGFRFLSLLETKDKLGSFRRSAFGFVGACPGQARTGTQPGPFLRFRVAWRNM